MHDLRVKLAESKKALEDLLEKIHALNLFLTFSLPYGSVIRAWWFPNFFFIPQPKKQPRVKSTTEDDLDDVSAACSSEAIGVIYVMGHVYIYIIYHPLF